MTGERRLRGAPARAGRRRPVRSDRCWWSGDAPQRRTARARSSITARCSSKRCSRTARSPPHCDWSRRRDRRRNDGWIHSARCVPRVNSPVGCDPVASRLRAGRGGPARHRRSVHQPLRGGRARAMIAGAAAGAAAPSPHQRCCRRVAPDARCPAWHRCHAGTRRARRRRLGRTGDRCDVDDAATLTGSGERGWHSNAAPRHALARAGSVPATAAYCSVMTRGDSSAFLFHFMTGVCPCDR